MKKGLVYALLLLAAIAWWQGSSPGSVPAIDLPLDAPAAFSPALNLAEPPIQGTIDWAGGPLLAGDFELSPQASFQIEARVLSRKDYRRGVEAMLSPVDLALGWGRMADPAVLESIRIRQSGRFYYWRVQEFPIPRREIEQSSANVHLIPANEEISRQLRAIGKNDHVRMAGFLVHVDRSDGWRWRTSMTRSDTGAGACEILLVTRVERI
jgi:hypothetical protein